MRVFYIDEETGSGRGRRAKEGETLKDFVLDTFKDEDLIRAMANRWPDEEDEEDPWHEFRPETWFELKPGSIADHIDGWEQSMLDNPSIRTPKVLNVIEDTRLDDDDWPSSTVMWVEAEVPDDTRYIWYGGCTPTLEGWCGMGGSGFIEIEEER